MIMASFFFFLKLFSNVWQNLLFQGFILISFLNLNCFVRVDYFFHVLRGVLIFGIQEE